MLPDRVLLTTTRATRRFSEARIKQNVEYSIDNLSFIPSSHSRGLVTRDSSRASMTISKAKDDRRRRASSLFSHRAHFQEQQPWAATSHKTAF